MPPVPVALFVYRRPTHTRQVVEALRRNPLARETVLYIFSDGPRTAQERPRVEAVRGYLDTIKGFRKVERVDREKNLGMARNIEEGVTAVAKEHGAVIVLEDDIVPSPGFLDYMNRALDRYSSEPQVMSVSAYMFPVPTAGLPPAFFLPLPFPWGWGTWWRAWSHYRRDPTEALYSLSREERRQFNLDYSYDFWWLVVFNYLRKLNSWWVFWYLTTFHSKGLTLFPQRSLVQNIGLDGSGESPKAEFFATDAIPSWEGQFPEELEVHLEALGRVKEFFRKNRQPLLRRWYGYLKILFGLFIEKREIEKEG